MLVRLRLWPLSDVIIRNTAYSDHSAAFLSGGVVLM